MALQSFTSAILLMKSIPLSRGGHPARVQDRATGQWSHVASPRVSSANRSTSGTECVVVLEDSAVPGVRIDDELRAGILRFADLQRTVGTIRSWSPFTIRVGWLIREGLADVARPHPDCLELSLLAL